MVYGYAFYTTVVIPVAAILFVNTLVLATVIYKLHQSGKYRASSVSSGNSNKTPMTETTRIISEARITFACNVLLGTTWIFALLAVGKATLFFQWLFCVFNSLQGFFIFYFYTVRNHDVRKAYLSKLKKGSTKRVSLRKLTPKKPSVLSRGKLKDPARNNKRGNGCSFDIVVFESINLDERLYSPYYYHIVQINLCIYLFLDFCRYLFSLFLMPSESITEYRKH